MKSKEQNRQMHNTYWNQVLNIIKEVNADIISLEDLCYFITYCEINRKFSLNVNKFNMRSLNAVGISNGYKPKYKSPFKKFRQEKKELVSKEIPANTTQIIDLGSGWGRYSILLSKQFPNATVYSLENSEIGIECCRLISEKYKLDNLICEAFDYHEPESLHKTVLPFSKDQNAFYFSSFSIEQIPYIKKEFFEIVLSGKYESLHGFHIEPIGWQINKKKKNTTPRYNNNLFNVLVELKKENKIDILKTAADIYGRGGNPGSIISWKKII